MDLIWKKMNNLPELFKKVWTLNPLHVKMTIFINLYHSPSQQGSGMSAFDVGSVLVLVNALNGIFLHYFPFKAYLEWTKYVKITLCWILFGIRRMNCCFMLGDSDILMQQHKWQSHLQILGVRWEWGWCWHGVVGLLRVVLLIVIL